MKWNEFIEKLQIAKKHKKTKGINVGAIVNLIFSGAFDTMIEEKGTVDVYHRMYKDVTKALGSSAKLPKAKKSESLGLIDVKSEAHLYLWRYMINPFSQSSFMYKYRDKLKLLGYEERYGKTTLEKRSTENKRPRILTDKLDPIYAMSKTPYFDIFRKNKMFLDVIGIVVDSEIRKYHTTKEMMKIKFFTGAEFVDYLIMWPQNDDGSLSESSKAMLSNQSVGVMTIVPGENRGSRTASIVDWQSLEV